MNDTPRRRPTCEAALRFLDSCPKHEAIADPDRETLKHLDECPACAKEFEAMARYTERLKHAVESQAVDPYLEARVRRSIREYESRQSALWSWSRRLLPVTAAVLVCAFGWIAYQLGHLRVTTGSQEAYIRAISARVPAIMRVGLGDHVHCTVFRKLPKELPNAAEMVGQLGPEYGALLALVKRRVPAQYQVVMAHRCSYHGRKFVHLALKSESNLVSLVITRKGEGESFTRDDLRPVLSEPGGLSIYEGSVQRFAIAGFESRGHLAYLVSDLGERQNLSVLRALALPVTDLLSKLEG